MAGAGFALTGSSQDQQVVRGTPAEPRVGGISSLSYSSDHEHGLRVLGSVHVGPPVVLTEAIEPYPKKELVVPIGYSFLFLQGSEWRKTSDGLYFRRPGETDFLGFKTWVRCLDASGDEDGRWEVDVAIRPRAELSWSAVETKLDISVTVDVARSE